MILGILLLLAGLTISAVAIYYSVLGLAAIFAAATIPIYIMGGALEVSKLIAASWLKANWHRATGLIKYYMLVAVVILMFITSMGIFGFLSKAHLDQSIPAGDVAAQVALLDEKIKIQKDNIDSAKRALEQMDSQVNQRLAGNNAQQSAERSVQIRKAQAKERASLQAEITAAQQTISKLNEERAPIASQLRKVEAEVGPIKYIAQFVYGQEADQGLLEKAVTWVIILIVLVFDPLAVVMLLASQMTFTWYKKDKEQKNDIINTIDDTEHSDNKNADSGLLLVPEPSAEPIDEPVNKPVDESVDDHNSIDDTTESILSKHPYLEKPFTHFKNLTPIVDKSIIKEELPQPEIEDSMTEDEESVEGKKYKLLPELQEETQKKKVYNQDSGTTVNSNHEIGYIQNAEQRESSLWNQVRSYVSDEFKPKDYLLVVFSKGQFEDFQYDPTVDTKLDKFIKDIKEGNTSFGDYPHEQLNTFARRIYELRKN